MIALAVVWLAKAADTQHTSNDSLTNAILAARRRGLGSGAPGPARLACHGYAGP